MNNTYSIAIIGAGKVGRCLDQLFSLCNYRTVLIGRDITEHENNISNADIVLITTNDDAIQSVCNSVAHLLKNSAIVSHCSGALDSSILSSAQQKGCYVASTHPLNTFPTLEASLATFKDTHHNTSLFCEGDTHALKCLSMIFENAGFNVVKMDSQAKTAYYTACVMACNYLTVLMDLSLTTAEHGGIDKPQFWQAVQPLIQATLTNITQQGTSQSLSGPIARGDAQTVTQHIDFLSQKDQAIGGIYVSLAEHALKLATQQGTLSDKQLDALKTVLDRK